MRKYLAPVTVITLLLIGAAFTAYAQLDRYNFTHDDIERRNHLYLPTSYDDNGDPLPLVVALHGGGGNPHGFQRFTRFSGLAETEGFAVLYAEGVGGSWNDGRNVDFITAQRDNRDDYGFLLALVDDLLATYNLDPDRVYVTGMSNGGFMSFALACDAADVFAAAAPVTATLPETRPCDPEAPIAMLIINGTDDPLIPYGGGAVTIGRQERGRIQSTADSIKFFAEHNNCGDPTTIDLPDTDPEDGATVQRMDFTDCDADTSLITIVGGGHTYPGSIQYLPVGVIGRATFDIDATEVIWAFFEEQSR